MSNRIILVVVILMLLAPIYTYSDSHIEKGTDWLLSHQSENCAWTNADDNPQYALRCLGPAGQKDESFRKAYIRLIRLQALNGSWNNNVDLTSFSVWSLMEIGESSDTSVIKYAVEWLKHWQRADGHWGTEILPCAEHQ